MSNHEDKALFVVFGKTAAAYYRIIKQVTKVFFVTEISRSEISTPVEKNG
jgi:hypothetical protein